MKLLIYDHDTKELDELAEKIGFEVVTNPSQITSQFDGQEIQMLLRATAETELS